MKAFELLATWPAQQVAVCVATAGGQTFESGSSERVFPWASVTKPATALVVLVSVEEGIVDLDEDAGPPGSTVRHLLAHASGLPPDPGPPIARPGTRRIYSNYGFEVLAAHVGARAEMPFADYFAPCSSRPASGPSCTARPDRGHGGRESALRELAKQLLTPSLVAPETLAEATEVAFPGLVGVLPGFGRQEPNDWGLGFELRDEKEPHWTGRLNSARTFGHFGQTGTFLWVDPEAGIACGCLTDLDFGPWAKEAWPRFSDAVLEELS